MKYNDMTPSQRLEGSIFFNADQSYKEDFQNWVSMKKYLNGFKDVDIKAEVDEMVMVMDEVLNE